MRTVIITVDNDGEPDFLREYVRIQLAVRLKVLTVAVYENVPQATLNQLRDLALRTLVIHEVESHSGAACMDERINLAGWLCHSLGVSSTENMMKVYDRAQDYGEHCAGQNSGQQ